MMINTGIVVNNDLTLEKLYAEFDKAGWDNEFIVTMPDSSRVYITPCGCGRTASRDDLDWLLANHEILPWLGSEPQKCVDNLNRYTELIKEHHEDAAKLADFYNEATAGRKKKMHPDDASFYSDWYKDVYGRRPR